MQSTSVDLVMSLAGASEPPRALATDGHGPVGSTVVLSPEVPDPYVVPTLTMREGLPDAATRVSEMDVLLVAAQGAVGKSSFASYLANECGLPLWGLEATLLGDGTYTGTLALCYGFDGAATLDRQLREGQMTILMDSLDEAVLRSGGVGGLEAFLTDVALRLSGREASRPAIVIFGRVEAIELAEIELAVHGLKVAVLELDYFDETAAVEFIDRQLDAATVRGTSGYNDDHRQKRDEFLACRDELLAKIGLLVSSDSDDLWSDRTVRSFLGYAPVLLAISSMFETGFLRDWIQYSEDPGDIDNDRDESLWSMVGDLAQWILDRESQKVDERLTDVKLFDAVGALMPDIEQARLLMDPIRVAAHVPTSRLVLVDRMEDYRQAVKDFAGMHPFLRVASEEQPPQKRFSNAVFREYTLALLLCRGTARDVDNVLGLFRFPAYAPTSMLSRFCLMLASGEPIPSEAAPLLMLSLTAQRSADSSAVIKVEEVQGAPTGSVRLAISVIEDVDSTGIVSGHIDLESGHSLELVGELRNLVVDVPSVPVHLGGSGPLLVRENVTIRADVVVFDASATDLMVRDSDDGSACVIEASSVLEAGAGRLPSVGQGASLAIFTDSAQYPWREFVQGPRPNRTEDTQVYGAAREFRSIVTWFYHLGGSDKGARVAYRDSLDASIGKRRLSRPMLEYCMEEGVVSVEDKRYLLDLEVAGITYDSVRRLDLSNDQLFHFVMRYVTNY